MKCLFYYYNYNERVEKKHDKCCNKKINTKITYTIPPYQYNRMYAYPSAYIKQYIVIIIGIYKINKIYALHLRVKLDYYYNFFAF